MSRMSVKEARELLAKALADIEKFGLGPEHLEGSEDEVIKQALSVVREADRKNASQKADSLEDRAKESRDEVLFWLEFDLAGQAHQFGISPSDLLDGRPHLSAILEAIKDATITVAPTSTSKGRGASSEMSWKLLAGREPMWISIIGQGKTKAQTAAVYYIAPSADREDEGSIKWLATKGLESAPTLSEPFSRTGRIRPVGNAHIAIASAYGVLHELAGGDSEEERAERLAKLIEQANSGDIRYKVLEDLGDPKDLDKDHLFSAFKARVDLSDFEAVS